MRSRGKVLCDVFEGIELSDVELTDEIILWSMNGEWDNYFTVALYRYRVYITDITDISDISDITLMIFCGK